MRPTKEEYYVGELAKSYGVTRDTIRLYDKKGILSPHTIKDNSYRCYDLKDLACLNYIMILKKLGLSLTDINLIVNKRGVQENLHMMTSQLHEIDQKIEELKRLKTMVKEYEHIFQESLSNLDVYTIRKSPYIIYKEITHSLSEVIEAFTSISKEACTFFTYIIDEDAFNHPDYAKNIIRTETRAMITSVALSYTYPEDICQEQLEEFKVYQYDRCIHAIIRCYTEKDYTSLVNIKAYMEECGYRACGPIISKLLFINNNNEQSEDYYEIWVPIIEEE